jgi:hypothetical protein
MRTINNARQKLYDYIENIRTNEVNGLTQLTPTQRAVIDKLYEDVFKEEEE